jgi:CheY-like chemotaxis protein
VPTAQTPILTPKRRILLIDDETALLKVLSRFLSRSWNVTTATSAPEALHHLEHTTYDAILCDLMMPGMSGMEFAETLASRSPNLRTRTFFLTGGAVTPAAQEFLSRPDVRHFEKPLDLPRLCAAIDQVATPTPTS